MAAVDTTAKEMEAFHVGQNDEMNVSSCSSLEFLCFHAPWNESLMLFLQKRRMHFFGIYLRTRGLFLFPELVWTSGSSHDSCGCCSCIHMFNALFAYSFVPCCNYAVSEFAIVSDDQNFLIMVSKLLTKGCG